MPSPAETARTGPDGPSVHAPLLARVVATACGVGHAPWAPGTFGSALGLLVAFIPGVASPPVLGALVAAGLLAGRWSADLVARETGHVLRPTAAAAKRIFQRGEAPHPDPSIVVIDEVVGMWTALLLLQPDLQTAAIAFTTFRAFDILKPPPCAALERIGDGWGIMLDDFAAGVYANLATRLILALIG